MKFIAKVLPAISLSLFIVFFAQGCGWMQGLRREIEGEEDDGKNVAEFDYTDPQNRFVPPPPANVGDSRTAALSGTPVDLSGNRAKHVRITANDFIAENTKNENSLWSEEGQNNYLFARNKLKMPGDLVSVVIEDGLRKDMVDSVKKLLPPEYRDQEIRVPGLTKEARDPAAETPAAASGVAKKNDSEPGAEDILTAEVLERYPNGNVRLRGIKRVPFKRQVRNIEVLAIVKGSEISEQDVVKSSKFYEQKVELYK
jgi:flagellar basal body L-ring protein FlgH